MTLAETRPLALDRAPIDHSVARRAMIDSQLRTSGVNDAFVLARMQAVPRAVAGT